MRNPPNPELLPGEEEESPRPKRNPAETVLLILAALCALLLVGVIAVSLPYFRQTPADPQALVQDVHVEEEQILKEEPLLPEETEPEVTTEPTIPPEANPYTQFDFQYNRDNYLICQAQDSYPGVDVSAFQGEIDWEAVAASGIKFAMIRLGYRGYGAKGNMVEDEYAQKNLQGAHDAGLYVGAYFFSQATNLQEVDDEIRFLLKILGDHELNMPLVLDWETVTDTGRTRNVDRRTLTDCLRYFCDEVSLRGFQPMIYFNWSQARRMLYLNELEDYPFWLALYQDRMTFPYRVEMWQYTCTGRVPGIQGDVDINIFMPDYRGR